jgi:hypothetical protein
MINSGFFLLSKDRFIDASSLHRFLPPVGRHRLIALSHYLLPAVALCEGGASSHHRIIALSLHRIIPPSTLRLFDLSTFLTF